jgi:hypothetical protein
MTFLVWQVFLFDACAAQPIKVRVDFPQTRPAALN